VSAQDIPMNQIGFIAGLAPQTWRGHYGNPR
jgi:hypothetical protein